VNVNLLLSESVVKLFLALASKFTQEITSLFLRMKAERKKKCANARALIVKAMTEYVAPTAFGLCATSSVTFRQMRLVPRAATRNQST
jgi:hypothetical protein